MRYSSLKIGHMGPFKSVEIDFDAIEGTIIAIAGGNGVGKSTLLELLTGGIAYRTCRTRGSLASLATSRESFVEATIVNGQSWTIRHLVDCVSAKGESLVLDAQRQPILPDSKVSAFDVWSKDHLMPPEVMYAAMVSVQQDRGFLSLKRADRMAVLLRVIGAERLEKLAKAARDKGSKVSVDLDTLRGWLGDVVALARGVVLAQQGLTACEQADTAKRGEAEAAREALRRAELLAVDSQAATEIRERRKAVVFRMDAAKQDITDNEERAGNNRKLIVDADAIRAAVTRNAELVKEAQECQEQSTLLLSESNVLATEAARAAFALSVAKRDQFAANDAVRRAQARLEDKPIIDAAIGAIKAETAKMMSARGAVDAAEKAKKDLESAQLSHKDDRINDLRGGLSHIMVVEASGPEAMQWAQNALADDDELVEAAKNAPRRQEEARQTIRVAVDALKLAESLRNSADKLAARAGEMKTAAEDLSRAQRNVTELQTMIDGQSPVVARNRSALESKAEETKRIRTRINAIRDEHLDVEKLAKRAKNLDQAEARIEELTVAHAAMTATHAQLESELAGLPESKEDEAPDIARHKRAMEHAEDQSSHASMSLGEARVRLLRAEEEVEKTAQLKIECRALEDELADWKKLAADLGKDGLQSLEVDAAVPTLNTMVNDILTTCVDTRFAVEFRTDRTIGSGQQREALDVQVVDNMKGRDALAETYSGGECSIVGEAVALGLTMLGCECAGIDDVTLVRDETGAALDPENREAYMRMLRHAATMVGARHVLFVSHDAAMIEAADARIMIDDESNVRVTT